LPSAHGHLTLLARRNFFLQLLFKSLFRQTMRACSMTIFFSCLYWLPEALPVLKLFLCSPSFAPHFIYPWPRAHGCRGGYVNIHDARVMVILFGRPIFLFFIFHFYSNLSQVSGHVRGSLPCVSKG
jgi:hypothetical protein